MLGGRVAWDASLPSDDAVERELHREDDDDDDDDDDGGGEDVGRVREQQPEREVAWGRGDAGYGRGSSWDSPGAALLGGWIGSRTVTKIPDFTPHSRRSRVSFAHSSTVHADIFPSHQGSIQREGISCPELNTRDSMGPTTCLFPSYPSCPSCPSCPT